MAIDSQLQIAKNVKMAIDSQLKIANITFSHFNVFWQMKVSFEFCLRYRESLYIKYAQSSIYEAEMMKLFRSDIFAYFFRFC